MRRSTFALTLAAAMTAGASGAWAQDFYRGKTINIIVGNTAGGGFDANGRLLSRHIAKHIPGKPDVIVTNMPGASSRTSVLYLDQNAPKDGTAMTIFNFGLIGESRLDPDKVKIDFRKYNWIGSIGMDIAVCYMWHTKGAKTLDEVRKLPQVVMGLTNVGTSNDVNQRIMSKIFGVNLKQVSGYPGSAELRLATERGELEGDCGAWGALPIEWIKDKKIYPFLRTAPIIPDDLPKDVPYAVDIAPTKQGADVIKFLIDSVQVGRPFIASSQVPAERIKILREAFAATMTDPDFVKDAEKLRLPVMPKVGDEALKIVESIYAAPQDVVDAARKLTLE